MKKTTTFEQALARLDEIVAVLDTGTATLDQSLKLFSEGAELVSFCSTKLEDAELTIKKLYPEEADNASV